MVELLERLCSIFTVTQKAGDDDDGQRSCQLRFAMLATWNADMEACLLQHRSKIIMGGAATTVAAAAAAWNDTATQEAEEEDCSEDSIDVLLSNVSALLHSSFRSVLQGQSLDQLHLLTVRSTTEEHELLERWKKDITAQHHHVQWLDLCEILRASQNWMRWYLQIYHDSRQQKQQQKRHRPKPADDETLSLLVIILQPWQTRTMLELYFCLVEELIQHHGDDNVYGAKGARYASQLLFYSTFLAPRTTSAAAHDQALTDAYAYLVSDCNFMERWLRLLVMLLMRKQQTAADVSSSSSTPSLMLSLVRNVHNALVSFPRQSTRAVEAARVDISSLSNDPYHDSAKWTLLLLLEPHPGETEISYKVAFRELALFILQHGEDGESDRSSPRFPGTADDDRRAELVLELLRCCYALRVGTDFLIGKQDDDDSVVRVSERWYALIRALLQLDAKHGLCYDCQVATVSLLMDASPEYGTYIIRAPDDGVGTIATFLFILDKQVTRVLKDQCVDDRATAALTPILAVLYKFCGASPAFLVAIREGIFCIDNKSSNSFFETAVAQEEERTGQKQAKNMAPLDAPEGTLRWKLIRLLTWPQGFIKRLAGELLFVLCHGQVDEFVRRVGMGNAMPLLGLKGLYPDLCNRIFL